MKKINIIIFTLISIFIFNIDVLAMDSQSVDVVENNTTVLTGKNIDILVLKNTNKKKSSANSNGDSGSGECGILGDPTNPETFAWYLNQVLNVIKFLGPVLVILTSIFDLIKVTAEQKQDGAIQKFGAKTLKRLIYAALLFVFPSVLNILLELIGLYGTCGIS